MWLNWSLPKQAFWLKMLAHVTLYVSIMFEEQSLHVASLVHKTMKRRTHIEVCFASFAWVHVPLDMWLNWSLPKHVFWLKMLAHVTLYVSIMFEEQSRHVASLVRKAVKRRTRSIDVCFASFAWVHVPLICDSTEACQSMFSGWRCLRTWHCIGDYWRLLLRCRCSMTGRAYHKFPAACVFLCFRMKRSTRIQRNNKKRNTLWTGCGCSICSRRYFCSN